ncbi:MAG: hypothetical protein O2894_08195 [Planctomycetota bacterium]|nr:hypothetical protein [Planctomycetota bacterium]
MNQRTLVWAATIAGFVMLGALVLFPLVVTKVGDKSHSVRAIETEVGHWLLLFGWVACGFSALVSFGKAEYIGVAEDKSRMLSFLGYKLSGFFYIALLIAGAGGEHTSYGFGFWLAFLASLAGGFAAYLTFNPALAQKLADKAKEMSAGNKDAEPPAA